MLFNLALDLCKSVDFVRLDFFVGNEEIIVDRIGLLFELGLPELSIENCDFLLSLLDSISMYKGFSGDHEPMDLLGESSVVGEGADHVDVLCGDFFEDSSEFSFIISTLKVP